MRRVWTEKMDNLLRRHYKRGDLEALALRLGVTVCALRCRARKIRVFRHNPWTVRKLNYLRRNYANTDTRVIIGKTNKSAKAIYGMAKKFHLKKSDEQLSDIGRRSSNHPNVIAFQFKKGHIPANKGLKEWQFRSSEGIARCASTHFKNGNVPANAKPIGYERIDKDGYVLIKVEGERKMVFKHRWLWQQAHGDIPQGQNVMFRDGNRMNCSLDNLELVSRADAARRQIKKETTEQRKARVDKGRAKRNALIRKDRVRIHFGLEPVTKLVKRW